MSDNTEDIYEEGGVTELRTLVAALRNLASRFRVEGADPWQPVICPSYGSLLSPSEMERLAEEYGYELLELEEGPPINPQESLDEHSDPLG